MIRLYIDNQEADINPLASLSISLSIASLTSTSWGRASYSKSITIPATPLNRQLMGDCQHPLSAEMFNHKEHLARVEVCGSVVIEGTIYLTSSSLGSNGYYRFNIIGNARRWAASASGAISQLAEEWGGELSEEMIAASLAEGDHPLVRFLPVARGDGEGEAKFKGRILPENYHPFLHIASLVERIFAKAGYAVESEFFGSEFFRSLYMSGRWSERVWADWSEKMNFRAVRRADSEWAKGNLFGRVYADPLANYSTVGNLVDLPEEGDEGCFNAGAFEQEYSGRVRFVPTERVVAAFEYTLRWRTQYRIISRTKLKGFSEIRPYYGDSIKLPMPNTFEDRREGGVSPNFEYTFIIFEPVEGATYTLVAEEVGATGERVRHELVTTSERTAKFSHNLGGVLRNLYVEMRYDGFIGSPASDWAIYDGYVSEVGTKVMEAKFRSMPEVCTPEKPFYFDLFYFGGAEEDMEMQLLKGCVVRPILYPHPTLGDEIGWGDVAGYSFTGLDLLGALRDMFDLQIYTDPLARKVCIEPRREFCDPAVVVDLSERVDTTEPILVEELGADHPKVLTLRYQAGDGAVDRMVEESGERYGYWSATVDHIFASEGANVVTNRLFAPSLSTSGRIFLAPSASLIMAGDVVESEGCVVNCNFPIKVVSFRGMRPLAEGERWDFPTEKGVEYPLVTFYDDGSLGGEPRSLLYEDCGGVEGLHRWWDGRVEALNHSRRLTLNLYLGPEDVEQIVAPNSTKHDFRAHYLLAIGGEKVLCRMEEIVDYNPVAPSTKVVFVTV